MSLGSTNTEMRLLKLQPNKISMFRGSLNLIVVINSFAQLVAVNHVKIGAEVLFLVTKHGCI